RAASAAAAGFRFRGATARGARRRGLRLPVLLEAGQRAFELLQPRTEAIHLFARLADRSEAVDRGLEEPVDLVMHLLDARLDGALAGAHELVQQLGRKECRAAPPLVE